MEDPVALSLIVDRLIAVGHELVGARRWASVRDLASDVLALSPESQAAKELLAIADAQTPGQSLSPGQRRHMTLIFCDEVGSTEFAQRHPPEDVRDILRMFYDTAGLVMRKHGGDVHRHLGDGVLGYFAYPRPHEDDPRRAVRAAMELLVALGEF